jgi:hypothetical protein
MPPSSCAATAPDSVSFFAYVNPHIDLRSIVNGIAKTFWYERRNEGACVHWCFGDMNDLLIIC